MSPFKSAGASVQSTTGIRGVRICGSNAAYIVFRDSVKRSGYPLHSPVSPHFPSRASPCAIIFQLDSNNPDETKFNSGRNEEQIEVRECLLLFDVESFVFQYAIQEYKDYVIESYNFGSCFVWV